jgi:hypothetical protein
MTSPFPQITSPPQAAAEVLVNEALETLQNAAVYGKNHELTSGLTWGYYGGRWGGFAITADTLTLAPSDDNYVVVEIATGVISVDVATTDWLDTSNFARVYKLTTSASAVTAEEDHRAGAGGLGGGSGGVSFTGGTLATALNEAPIATIASAGTTNIGAAAANTLSVTGTTTITAFDTIASGARRTLIFAGILTLTHNGTSLILPTGASITTAADDTAHMVSLGSGNWKCVAYLRKSGAAVAAVNLAGGSGSVTGVLPVANFSTGTPSGTKFVRDDGVLAVPSGAGLSYFVESQDTASPNNTINDSRFLVSAASTNADMILTPKGSGATVAQRADGTTAGGDKRGAAAVDFQRTRSNTNQVAAGDRSLLGGQNSRISNAAGDSVAWGQSLTVTGGSSAVFGANHTVSASNCGAIGNSHNVSAIAGMAFGNAMTVSGNYGGCFGGDGNSATTGNYPATLGGNGSTASGAAAVVLGGVAATASGDYSQAMGRGAHTKGLQGAFARASENIWGSGSTQWMSQLQSHRTTDATQTVLNGAGTGAAAAANSLVLDNNSARAGCIRVLGFKTSGTIAAYWEIDDVLATRGASAGTTAFIGTPTVTTKQIHATATSESWACTVAINTTLGSIEVKVVGGASSSVRWIANFDGLLLV